MEGAQQDPERFSLARRAKSFAHAGRGIAVFFRSAHNAWVQCGIFILAVILGVCFRIAALEWALVILASGFVFAAEAFNSAIETAMDLASPGPHPYARDAKDMAAGAVLIAAFTAILVGIFVFGPHIAAFF